MSDTDWRRETDGERVDREHDDRIARRDRAAEKGSVPSEAVLPRDIEDWPAAQARVEQLADVYASVEVDRLPPMGAHHWLVTGHRADGSADVFRVGAHGSLMPWPVKPRFSFTQPTCDDCWDERHAGTPSPRTPVGAPEACCYCGADTRSGIYVRVDPATVAFPSRRREP